MLGTVTNTEAEARQTLRQVVEAGFEGIELNGFMTRPTTSVVGLLTRLAGMPTGRGGRLDWAALVAEAGLAVVGLHEDLGTLEREPDAVATRAVRFGSPHVVVPGMYRFDYTDAAEVAGLAERLNRAGDGVRAAGLRLLYHNHNAEFRLLAGSGADAGVARTAFDLLLELTDPALVAFEFDAYWPTAVGADAHAMARRLGERMAMMHLTDRGTRRTGPSLTPIDKADTVELGLGTMNLAPLLEHATEVGAHAVILETHRNWVGRSPIASFRTSSAYLRRSLPDVEEIRP